MDFYLWDFQMILRIASLLLLCTVCATAMDFTSRTEGEIKDVALHDGRHIAVDQTIQWKTEFRIFHPIIGIAPRFETTGPDTFHLKFKHPDTQETITWQGELYYTPVLLDIVDGIPYLVVLGRVNKETESIYGCPELPYSYLKYDPGFFGKWVPVPVEKAPGVLRESNLSLPSRNDGGFFQRTIPRTYEEWHYEFKNNYRNERKQGDCRPPLQPLPDVPLPKPVDIELETVESTIYILKSSDEYYKYLSERKGTITRANCFALFRPPKPENLMLGERFVKDPTGSKRLPYSGPSPLPLGMLETRAERYCDDEFVWFVAGHEELGKTIITKYSITGDFIYNIRISNPKNTDGRRFAGKMVLDSLTTENNFFYFYWNQDIKRSDDQSLEYPNRMLKFRFREPINEAASK
ncbi:MAG: hypothetical protein JSR88_11030 [Proteobacteria bacterium]|nr:hypothetical protein [Pseudomonadota bacterium]